MTQTAVDTEVIKAAVQLACRAPSLHNSQPWRWVAIGSTVDLFADPHRVVTSIDPSGRQSLISCGAVLDHFRVAMAAIGWDIHVDEFPNPNNRDHLASIEFSPVRFGADEVTGARRDRAAAISRRRTDRRPFRAPKDWASFEPVLRSCFDGALATLDVVADEARSRLAEASHLTEALRRYDDLYQHELRWWTAPSRGDQGIPPGALPTEAQAGAVEVNRRFPDGVQTAEGSAAADDAKIVVLSTTGETRADALDCGQALSAVLLECTIAGLATCAVTHLTELEAGRGVVRGLLPDAAPIPQVLIRVGAVPVAKVPAEPTPRRPLEEVLEIRGRRDQPG